MVENRVRQMFIIVCHQVRRAPGINAFRHQCRLCFTRCIPAAVKDIDGAGDNFGSHVGRHDYLGLVVKNSD